MKKYALFECCAIAAIAATLAGNVLAEAARPVEMATKVMSPEEVRARYQSCPSGYYSGPRPGKTRFTQDPWVWAVTPQFAADYCMPPEFISRDLKGAEAIAYKMMRNDDEVTCGWGENAEICNAGYEHRFEIYYKTGAIPKENDLPYYQVSRLPSKMLISQNSRGMDISLKRARELKRPGTAPIFPTSQFGLLSIRGDKFAWPMGALYTQVYFQELLPGLDYIALEGGGGFSRNDNWIKHGTREFVVTVRKVPDPNPWRKDSRMSMDEFALVIALPSAIGEAVIKNDQAKGIDVVGMARRALAASGSSR